MTIDNIRIGVIIPTRGDREMFLQNCMRMLKAQTLQPKFIHIIDEPPIEGIVDITKRYRLGYNAMSSLDNPKWTHLPRIIDVIAWIEDDDFYCPDYLETMATEWLNAKQPDILGTGKTIYYHLNMNEFLTKSPSYLAQQYRHISEPKYPNAYFIFNHPLRASAMNTLIKPGLDLLWPEDSYAYTDMHLWNTTDIAQLAKPRANRLPKNKWLKGHIFNPEKVISIGMKHGVGLCGGNNHTDRLERYNYPDFDRAFLKTNCDNESFEFYSNLFK